MPALHLYFIALYCVYTNLTRPRRFVGIVTTVYCGLTLVSTLDDAPSNQTFRCAF